MPADHRRFTLLDAVVLVAALAVGFALTRDMSGLEMISDGLSIHMRAGPGPRIIRGAKNSWVWFVPASAGSSGRWSVRLHGWIFRASPCLAAYTVAVLGLGLGRPRPPLRRLFRRPGSVACLAVGAALAAAALQYPMLWAGNGTVRTTPNPGDSWQMWRMQLWFFLSRYAGYGVAVCWLTLWLGGLWRARRSWVDRLGRVLGACWVALALAGVAASFLLGFSL